VRHIAIRARCLNTVAPYTTPGLGDRIHSAIIGWVYGQCTAEPVTLHLTHDKWHGGQFGNKSDSWGEIVSLFPAGSLKVRHHLDLPHNEQGWLASLRRQGIEAEMYSYGDYPGKYETVAGFNVAPLLRSIPPLTAEKQEVKLPAKFFTVQWDSNAKSRSVPKDRQAAILERYKRTGYKPVVVGGESPDPLLQWSLKHIAYAMSKAAFHVGVDSAFFHMAQLYMPWERIHLYGMPGGFKSHHALRARDNGAQINLHL
jgi:hypothetical protein